MIKTYKSKLRNMIKGIVASSLIISIGIVGELEVAYSLSNTEYASQGHLTGWYLTEDNWYYYKEGNMVSDSWHLNEDGYWYWLKYNGIMAKNEWLLQSGEYYRFTENGNMLSDTWYLNGDGYWYWLKSSGIMAKNEWLLQNGDYYRFTESGSMLSDTWYLNGDGYWYWLKSDGRMAKNETINIDGVTYKFNENGVMLEENNNINSVIGLAVQQLGKPYKYGEVGPDSFDCSGFTSYIYKNSVNINLPRTASSQSTTGTKINKSELKEGDLVFFNTSGTGISHVGLYIGNSQFIHSPRTGDVVKIDSLNSSYYSKAYVTATRIL